MNQKEGEFAGSVIYKNPSKNGKNLIKTHREEKPGNYKYCNVGEGERNPVIRWLATRFITPTRSCAGSITLGPPTITAFIRSHHHHHHH